MKQSNDRAAVEVRWVRSWSAGHAKDIFLLLPTVSTGLVRLLQLSILLVLANIASGSERNLLVAGFGLLTSFAMMTDSGAGIFLLSTPLTRITRHVYSRSIGIHAAFAVIGSVLALLFISYPVGGRIPPTVLLLLAAFAVTQSVDSTFRVIRAPILVAKRDVAYAVPDVLLVCFKLPIILCAFLLGNLDFLLLLPIPSIAVAAVIQARIHQGLETNDGRPIHLYRQILEYGITGALSALYSQAPLLIATAFLPLPEIATLAIIYRVVQALDLVPGTISLQMMPRVRERGSGPWGYWLFFVAGAAVISLGVMFATPLIELLFGQSFGDILVFFLVTISFIPKSGNYALSAYLMGTGHIRSRFVLTIIACIFAVGFSFGFTASTGIRGLASVTLIVELLFTVGAKVALKRTITRGPRSVNQKVTLQKLSDDRL